MFRESKPVWAEGRSKELNLFLEFDIPLPAGSATVRITASTAYQLYGDGRFMAYGPARAGDGHFRVDEWKIGGLRALRVLVAGYYTSCFQYTLYPSFLNLEVLDEKGDVLLATGRDRITCREYSARVRHTDKMARQRVYAEVYDFGRPQGALQTLEVLPEPVYLPRRVSPFSDEVFFPEQALTDFEVVKKAFSPELTPHGRSPFNNNIHYLKPGYGKYFEDNECLLFSEVHELGFERAEPAGTGAIEQGRARLFAFDRARAGLIGLKCRALRDTRLYLIYDELLTGGDVAPRRMNVLNAMRLDLPRGDHHFLSFEPNCLKYIKLCVVQGALEVEILYLVEQGGEGVAHVAFADAQLQQIYDAAANTYRQNATDIFMDCPSRERAGWLCDSFFTGRCEFAFTGDNRVETSFLENFYRNTGFRMNPEAPKGILPMLYPGDTDFIGGREYIVNWNFWLIIELAEYAMLRRGCPEVVEGLKAPVYAILAAMQPYENEFGLIENMPGWVFVEWSRANDRDVVCGVNYPSNMLYAGALEAAGRVYRDEALIQKAERVRAVIREQSYNGVFFADNAVRREGELVLTGNTTETCQYYAFMLRTATPDSHPELWEKLTADFGPGRKRQNPWPDVAFSNAFIGNYLRLEALMMGGRYEQTLSEIRGYFGFMAEQNGALWEYDTSKGSCCHGFAAYAGVLLMKLKEKLGLD